MTRRRVTGPERHGKRRGKRRGGFALLIVLWALVPLSAIMLTLTTSARSEGQLTFNLRDEALLEAAADGAVFTVVFALLRPGEAAGSMAAAGLTVAVESLSGLVNPNTAPPELFRALLLRLGAGPEPALRLAAAIADWRTPGRQARPGGAKAAEYRAAGLDYGPPGAPFETLDELRLVLGMTPALFTALQPLLTLATDQPPDPAVAPAIVRAALSDIGVAARGSAPAASERGNVFRITAEARNEQGARVVRSAVVKLTPAPNGRPWRILAWETVLPTP